MKVIIWDFDGVIIFSEEVRVRGFEILLRQYPTVYVEQLLRFHAENGGLSRYVKIRFFYEKILKEPITDDQVQTMAMEFSDIMRTELTDPGLLNPEWLRLMEEIDPSIKHHIASGSDGDELRFLCSELGIAHHFESILGSPTPKSKLVEEIMEQCRYSNAGSCLVGDAINDWEAASQNSIQFFGYRNNVLKFKGHYLNRLSELKDYWN